MQSQAYSFYAMPSTALGEELIQSVPSMNKDITNLRKVTDGGMYYFRLLQNKLGIRITKAVF